MKEFNIILLKLGWNQLFNENRDVTKYRERIVKGWLELFWYFCKVMKWEIKQEQLKHA